MCIWEVVASGFWCRDHLSLAAVMEIQSFRAHSVKVVAFSGCRHDVSGSTCLLTLALLSAEGVVVAVILSRADIVCQEEVRLLPVGSIAMDSPVRPRAGTRGEHHDATQLRFRKKRGCFQGEENELFTHTHPSDETSPHEQKGSLNTLPTRTVVMKTSHETSTGAAKQTWSTSSSEEAGPFARMSIFSLVCKCERRPTHNHLRTHTPRATEPAHSGPTISHLLGAQNIYLSATLLPN